MSFTIDYPSSIECLREFYSSELRKEKLFSKYGDVSASGLEQLREDFAEYPKLLQSLHGTTIEFNPDTERSEEEIRLLCSLDEQRTKLGEIVAKIQNRYPDFENQDFSDLNLLSQQGLSNIYKQLAVHPNAIIAKEELQAFCLELNRVNDLALSAIPTLVTEQIYIQNTRDRYLTALCIYQINCHSSSCSRKEFKEKFETLSNHHKTKGESIFEQVSD